VITPSSLKKSLNYKSHKLQMKTKSALPQADNQTILTITWVWSAIQEMGLEECKMGR